MAVLDTITREIDKNKNLEMNLSRYANEMMSLYYRYSYTRLSYNYFAVQEMLQEDELGAEFLPILQEIDAIIENGLFNDCLGADREKAISAVNTIRDGVIASMKVLTSYADCLQIYEYLLNRLDSDNPEHVLPEDYSDDKFANELIQYIFSDRDNSVISAKISDMVGQLPVRMTRQKYFELIRDAFSLYKDASKDSVDNFVYMLRSLTMLDKPEGFGNRYPEIYRVISDFFASDFENITKEQYNVFEESLRNAAETITELSSKYMYIQEIVNDVYVILLAKAYAIVDSADIEACNTILGADDTTAEEVFKALESLEGRQERFYESFAQYDYIIENSDKYKDTIESCMLTAVYASLSIITKLVSTSSFIELNKAFDNEIAGESYVEKARDELVNELIGLFEGKSRRFVRSIMAATLSTLPTFIGNADELQAYIRHSLMTCSDNVEKGVCVSLMNRIMSEYNAI